MGEWSGPAIRVLDIPGIRMPPKRDYSTDAGVALDVDNSVVVRNIIDVNRRADWKAVRAGVDSDGELPNG